MASSDPSTSMDNSCNSNHNQPIIASANKNDSSDANYPSKRKGDTSKKSTLSATKKPKLRSSDNIPTGKFPRLWDSRPNYPVWVHTINEDGKRKWKPGIVKTVIDYYDGYYEIVVNVDIGGGEMGITRTYNPRNNDPIPNVVKSNPDYDLSYYVQARDEREEGLSDLGLKHWKCFKYHGREILDMSKIPEQDIIGKSVLENDPNCQTSIQNIIYSLMINEEVKSIIRIATGEEECSAQHALAYLIGQLCGIELSEQSMTDVDPKGLLDQIGSNDNIDCPTSNVFLMSAMCARTKKMKEFNPSTGLYDYRGKAVFSDPEKLKARMGRLKTALAAMHSSQNDKPSLSGPASALLSHGIHLMIDMRGTSDSLLNQLAREGICRPAKVIRVWIQKFAEVLHPLDNRSPPPKGKTCVRVHTADNADYHLFHNVVSCVPVGNILLDYEAVDDTEHFNKNYMKGLGSLNEIEPEHLAATKEEDDYAQNIVDIQNIIAILTAAISHNWLDVDESKSTTSSARHPARPTVGSTAKFTYRSQEREGKVISKSSKEAVVEFSDGGRDVRKPIALDCFVESQNTMAHQGAASIATMLSSKSSQQTFDEERHRFHPSTTTVSSVLTGLSSKNSETARQIIHEVKAKHGENDFEKQVHVIVADQEFMPTMMNQFFSKLGRDDELPVIPALAIGHTMKNLSVSMMSYYQCYFDPMLETIGIKSESAEYKRLYKGSVIRNTNRMVSNFTEMLAVSAARLYLGAVGRENRIEVAAGRFNSPNAIISTYFDDKPDPTARSVTAMDCNMRPIRIVITDQLIAIAKDFHKWAKGRWGTTERSEVGPSGFERTSKPQEKDSKLVNQSQEIENDSERYGTYQRRKYGDEGDTLGLLSTCKKEGLLEKSSRKDKETLAKKLYLLEVKKDREAAKKFGPARKVPPGTNSSALVVYDILFGVERFVIVQGHLLTRVRPKEWEAKDGEQYPRDWLVFFKALTTSTFMRWQPNYQRLALSFLIQLTLILKHDDPRCTDLALKRIRLTFCVSESGDSHKTIPVDELQESTMVRRAKEVGGRNPNATKNLESRVRLYTFLRLLQIEQRWTSMKNAPFDSICPTRVAVAQEERRVSRSFANVWLDILKAVEPLAPDADAKEYEKIQGFGNEDSSLLFACQSRLLHRSTDAIDHVAESAMVFIKGARQGYEVALPPRAYPLLRGVSCSGPMKKSKVQLSLADDALQLKSDAEQSLTEDKRVPVHSSHSLLDGIAKAGEGKAGIYPAILKTMSHNNKYRLVDGQIGDGPSKPVILSRTKRDATRHVMDRALRLPMLMHAPVFCIVDVAKDLHGFIPQGRIPGHRGTMNELAMDIICETYEKYYTPGIEMICLTMDVPAYMTSLRVIPHAKRGKMDGVKIPHGSLSKVKKGSDDLTPHGTRSDLLTCGDPHFIKLLFDTICNQARALENNQWTLHRPVPKEFALVVAGGSAQACIAVGVGGKTHVRLNSQSITVSLQQVEEELASKEIVKSEEGEMMIYAAMASIIRLGFTHENWGEGIDGVFVLHSDDSDAFAGISMQAMYNLESTCMQRNRTFGGAIYLHGPRKSVPQVGKLGKIFETNIEVDLDMCPTGRGFEFMVDLLAVYYTLEDDDTMPLLPPGHRAISSVGVVYTLSNNDYLKLASHGVTATQLIRALRSPSYKREVKDKVFEEISPINLTRQAVFMDQNHNIHKGYHLPGILILLSHAFINRPRTKKVLLAKYDTTEKLGGGLAYDVIRAAAILAGELQPVPDPIALLAHLSCANLLFRRWTVHVYGRSTRTDDELGSTSYREKDVKGRTVMYIDYNLREVVSKGLRWSSLGDKDLVRELKTRYYGSLLPKNIASETDDAMPFSPLEVIKLALNNRGLYPVVKVPSELLPDLAKVAGVETDESNVDDVEELVHGVHDDLVDSDDEESDDEDEESVAGPLSDEESETSADEF